MELIVELLVVASTAFADVGPTLPAMEIQILASQVYVGVVQQTPVVGFVVSRSQLITYVLEVYVDVERVLHVIHFQFFRLV